MAVSLLGRLGGPPATDMPDEYDWHYWVEQVLEEVIQQVRRCFESEGATWIPLRFVTVGGVRRRLLQCDRGKCAAVLLSCRSDGDVS